MPFDFSVAALLVSVAHEKTAVEAHRTLRPGLPRGYQLSSLAAAKEVEGSQKVNSKKCIPSIWDQKVYKSLYHSSSVINPFLC